MIEFNKTGFPIIRLHDDSFEIKAIDYWEFRTFLYSEVTRIRFYKKDMSLFVGMSTWLIMQETEPFYLRIYKNNGGDWSYETPAKEDPEFMKIVDEIRKRCGVG